MPLAAPVTRATRPSMLRLSVVLRGIIKFLEGAHQWPAL
jgi:hypothetical protein